MLELAFGAHAVSVLELPAGSGEVVQAAQELVLVAEPEPLRERARRL